MSLLSILVVLLVVGFVVWLLLQVPIPAPFHRIIVGVVCLFMVLWLLQQFNLIPGNLRLR